MAAILWRVVGSPEPASTLDKFPDVGDVSGYAAEVLCWIVEQGIISGKGNGTLAPRDSATRAEVSAMLMRFVSKL